MVLVLLIVIVSAIAMLVVAVTLLILDPLKIPDLIVATGPLGKSHISYAQVDSHVCSPQFWSSDSGREAAIS